MCAYNVIKELLNCTAIPKKNIEDGKNIKFVTNCTEKLCYASFHFKHQQHYYIN